MNVSEKSDNYPEKNEVTSSYPYSPSSLWDRFKDFGPWPIVLIVGFIVIMMGNSILIYYFDKSPRTDVENKKEKSDDSRLGILTELNQHNKKFKTYIQTEIENISSNRDTTSRVDSLSIDSTITSSELNTFRENISIYSKIFQDSQKETIEKLFKVSIGDEAVSEIKLIRTLEPFFVFFACLAGLIFLVISKKVNSQIEAGEIVLANRKTEWGPTHLSIVMLIWALLTLLQYFESTLPRELLLKDRFLIMRGLLEMLKNSFFLMAMYEFDFYKMGLGWRENKLAKTLIPSKKAIAFWALVFCLISVIIYFLKNIDDGITFEYAYIPVSIFSTFTLLYLFVNLWALFKNRNMVSLQIFTALVLLLSFSDLLLDTVEILGISVSDMNISDMKFFTALKDDLFPNIINITANTQLVTLFLLVSYSWMHYYEQRELQRKKNELENEKESIIREKERIVEKITKENERIAKESKENEYLAKKSVWELEHRLKNYLGRIYDKSKELRRQNAKNLKDPGNLLKEMEIYTQAYDSLSNLSKKLGVEEEGEKISFYQVLENLVKKYKDIYGENFQARLGVGERFNFLISPKNAQIIVEVILELVNNAHKYSIIQKRDNFISLKIDVLADEIFHIEVNDRNMYFDLNKKIKERKKGGLYKHKLQIETSLEGTLHCERNHPEEGNIIVISIPMSKIVTA